MRRARLLAPLALALASLTAAPATAQLTVDEVSVRNTTSRIWGPGEYMRQALDRALAVARDVALDSNYRLDNTRTCILGSLLDEGESARMRYTMRRGERLVFVGGGDRDINDLDLYIRDSQNNVLARDVRTDATPVVRFTVPSDGEYVVELKNYDSDRNGFGSVMILRANAPSQPLDSINLAVNRVLEAGRAVHAVHGGAAFDNDGGWSLFGSIMNQGSTRTISNVARGDRRHAFVAAGDASASDIDLYLLDRNDNQLERDIRTDPNPYFAANTPGESYKIRVKNYRSSGPSLVLWAVLDIAN